MRPIWSALLLVALAATAAAVGRDSPSMLGWLGPFVRNDGGVNVDAVAINAGLIHLQTIENIEGEIGLYSHTTGVIEPTGFVYDLSCPGSAGIKIGGDPPICGITKIQLFKHSDELFSMTVYFGDLCQLEVMISELRDDENNEAFKDANAIGEFDVRRFLKMDSKKQGQPITTYVSWLATLLWHGLKEYQDIAPTKLYKTHPIRIPKAKSDSITNYMKRLKVHRTS